MAALNNAICIVGLYPHLSANHIYPVAVETNHTTFTASSTARATATAPTLHPSPSGGFIPVSPSGPR